MPFAYMESGLLGSEWRADRWRSYHRERRRALEKASTLQLGAEGGPHEFMMRFDSVLGAHETVR